MLVPHIPPLGARPRPYKLTLLMGSSSDTWIPHSSFTWVSSGKNADLTSLASLSSLSYALTDVPAFDFMVSQTPYCCCSPQYVHQILYTLPASHVCVHENSRSFSSNTPQLEGEKSQPDLETPNIDSKHFADCDHHFLSYHFCPPHPVLQHTSWNVDYGTLNSFITWSSVKAGARGQHS